MTTADPMMIGDDSSSPSPQDACFLEALKEPLKSFAEEALDQSVSASARADGLEIALRSHLLQLTGKLQQPNNLKDIQEYWKLCLDLCLHLVHNYKDMGTAVVRKLPFVLLEDCCETLPLHLVQTLWTCTVEPSISVLCGELLWVKTSHLVWIRICNNMLKKLKSNKWAGRILLNLASVFPLSERSAMNVLGSFHVDNVTDYETLEEFQLHNDENEEEEENKEVHDDDKKKTEKDYAFYQTFWSIQSDFSNPSSIDLHEFSKRMQTIMAVLESHTLHASSSSTFSTTAGKYLTNSHLLHLQLSDPELRIHFLTQYLIVESFLEKSPLLKQVTKRAKDLLQHTPPHGKAHLQTIEWLLEERESIWRQWKRNKCTPDLEKKASVNKKQNLPSVALSSIKEDDDDLFHYSIDVKKDLPGISSGMKEVVPELHAHLEEYVEALDPEAGIDAEYHPKNDKLFSWRAMRLLTQEHLGRFDLITRRDGDFEPLVRHIYKEERNVDIPGEAPEAESLEEYDEPPEGQSQESADDVSVGSPMETEEKEGGEDGVTSEKAAEFEKAALEEEEEMLQEEEEEEKPKEAATKKEAPKENKVDEEKSTKQDEKTATKNKEDLKEKIVDDEKKGNKPTRPAAKRDEPKGAIRKENDKPTPRNGPGDDRRGQRGRPSPARRSPPDRSRVSPERRDGGRGDVGRDDHGRQVGRRDRHDGRGGRGGRDEPPPRGRSVDDRNKRRRTGGRRSY